MQESQDTQVRSLDQETTPGGGNGSPLQCSCLEDPWTGGAWRATVYGVAKSRTGLKRVSTQAGTQNCMRVRMYVRLYVTMGVCVCVSLWGCVCPCVGLAEYMLGPVCACL